MLLLQEIVTLSDHRRRNTLIAWACCGHPHVWVMVQRTSPDSPWGRLEVHETEAEALASAGDRKAAVYRYDHDPYTEERLLSRGQQADRRIWEVDGLRRSLTLA
jgi:hypothetical protein